MASLILLVLITQKGRDSDAQGLRSAAQLTGTTADPGSRASLRNCSPSSLVSYRIDPPFSTLTGMSTSRGLIRPKLTYSSLCLNRTTYLT